MKLSLLLSFLLLLFCIIFNKGACQQKEIFSADLENFWIAYDSVTSVTDSLRQLDFINRLYVDKGTDGLKAFLRNKAEPAKKWVQMINTQKTFFESIRNKTIHVKNEITAIENALLKFHNLYPEAKPGGIYFLVGFNQQGGTIRGNMSLIGTEVVMASEAGADALLQMCLHEYVHTQQTKPDFQKINVLTSSIREGACDFIAELVLQKPHTSAYMAYGTAHEKEVASAFKKDMFTTNNDNWVSTGDNPNLPAPDLGYFTGYMICKSYYQNMSDKQEAIKNIIELDYANDAAVEKFLKQSNYKYLSD